MRIRNKFWIELPVLLAACASWMHAAKYAVIAGVGQYPYLVDANGRPANDLDGPKFDAAKMAEALVRYGYPRANITVLVDAAGTRQAILGALKRIAGQVKSGDHVVFYYSGHGTSSLDEDTHGFGLDAGTGAVIPSDLRIGNTHDVLPQLIVGKRDLQPMLGDIERQAEVLVIFDACFSGESVKSITLAESPVMRYVSLSSLTRGAVSSESIKEAEQAPHKRSAKDYPYQRVVYLSAAANNEPALDIGRRVLTDPGRKLSTFDGSPHGAFTNVLLRLMEGSAGSSESCRQFFNQASAMVQEQGRLLGRTQSPQLLYSPSNQQQVDRPCFALDNDSQPSPPTQPPAPQSGIRRELDTIASRAAFKMDCRPSKPEYRDGESTTLNCETPKAGYLEVISYGEGDGNAVLLYPNQLDQNNHLGPGAVQIPSRGTFNIENFLPNGMSHQEQVMLVVFSQTPLEDPRSLGTAEGIFRSLSAGSFRSQRVTSNSYGAAELVFQILK
jgi:hypothetical protein